MTLKSWTIIKEYQNEKEWNATGSAGRSSQRGVFAEKIGIFSYFPSVRGAASAEMSFQQSTLRVAEFMRGATDTERLQYERFVVIKEACGNLFTAILLSLPAWFLYFISSANTLPGVRLHRMKMTYLFMIVAFLTFGLFRMHGQHVDRQFMFADELAKKHNQLIEIEPTKQRESAKEKEGKAK